MDLSQYAELFLAESREHLSACNQLLLEWERSPANLAPVGGLFRAVHTVKGMAATMGYARVTDVAHRAENLLDLLRRGGRPATDELLQLLFRARDALEQAVELSVVGREDEIDVAEVVADLDGAAAQLGRGGGGRGRDRRAPDFGSRAGSRRRDAGGGRAAGAGDPPGRSAAQGRARTARDQEGAGRRSGARGDAARVGFRGRRVRRALQLPYRRGSRCRGDRAGGAGCGRRRARHGGRRRAARGPRGRRPLRRAGDEEPP